MALMEQILLKFCKNDKSTLEAVYKEEWDERTALNLLRRVYPDLDVLIKDKVVCDFGCGAGYQSVALVKSGVRKVIAVESNRKRLEFAGDLVARSGLGGAVEFYQQVEERLKGTCDVVISQNSMEHFSDPLFVLELMKTLLNKNGVLLITFGPPWYAPYGSHMQFFTNLPWVNILFPEKTVMRVRGRFRNDGAKHYEEVESGLNKMSVGKFESIIRKSGLRIATKKYECVKGLDLLGTLPLVRELFINHISCSLIRNE